VQSQIYKFASNEYRYFPVELTYNLCHELKDDHFGIVESLRKSAEFKLECPFKKGFLSLKNGMIDFSKFPPHAPLGQYMDQVVFWDNGNFVGEVQVEAVIETFKQDDYTVKPLILRIAKFNRSYSTDAKCDLHWFNRSTRVINCNAHLLRDLSNNLRVHAQIYKFASNEYRLFPVELSHNLCHELKEDHFGIIESIRKSVNVKLECPFKK
ncbi:hypothetical protein ILUMI_05428, partial [Ignelater luminosus]